MELRHAIWPLTAPAVGRAVVAVGVLALGELSASKLVATPGNQLFGETFAHVDTPGGYIEIDTQQDFEYARRHWTA